MYLGISGRPGRYPKWKDTEGWPERGSCKTSAEGKGGLWGSCRQALTLGILRDKVDQGTLQPLIKVQNNFGLKVSDWPTLTKNRGPSM